MLEEQNLKECAYIQLIISLLSIQSQMQVEPGILGRNNEALNNL